MTMHRFCLPLTFLAVAIAIALAGCGTSSPPDPDPDREVTPRADTSKVPEEHDHAVADPPHPASQADGSQPGGSTQNPSNGGDMEKMAEGLAKLSPTDRASAEKQHFCPVSGKMLGTMGAPIKVTVEGREVWLCCSACEDPLRADPDKYLGKLNNHQHDRDSG